jgi:FtsP/CotA-like multicopper oxidase with cupredoxin domain
MHIIILLAVLTLSNSVIIKHEWTVRYATFNPDGVYRIVLSIDDGDGVFKFPGPTIRARKNDVIQVNVHNDLTTEAISIHWHGIHQMNTPWMDGVSFVTQYPILPMQTFNYTFIASPIGTHWYHSHTGAQYADGLFGVLIVEDPNDPYGHIPEFSLAMTEWWHKYAIDQFDILSIHPTPHHHNFPRFLSGIMNGKGRHNCSLIQQPTLWLNTTSIEEENQLGDKLICTPNRPYERFVVVPDQTYRFRLIAAGSEFNYKFSIDNHILTIIATDGVYVEPYTVQQLYIYVGQRYDVLVTMDQQSYNGAFWIRAAITAHETDQFYSILQYNDATNQTAEPSITTLPLNQTFLLNSMPLVPTSDNTDFTLKPPTFNETHILHLTCAAIAHRCTVDSISYKMPHEPTLYTLFKQGQKPMNSPGIINLKMNDHVMIVMNNFQNFGHSFHLHGHSFYLLGVGNRSTLPLDEPILFDPLRDRHKLNFINPPYRDTEQLPELTYMVIGFIANNPGSWLFHCHLAWDMEAGMIVLFNVIGGQLPPPPQDYPLIIKYKDITTSSGNNIHLTTLLFLLFLVVLSFIQ